MRGPSFRGDPSIYMSENPGQDYDRVTYPSMAHPQTFAETLAIKGLLRGLEVASPDRCRVLELGCGDGFNLAAMAVSHPEAHYTGIDYSAEAVARGRRMLADLNLAQVRLEAADIRNLEGAALAPGSFDYIMAHGVYSWVPAEVRDALLASIGRLLAPQGVAFVSYLALPGAYQRETVRSIIRYHTRGEKDPQEQVKQSRSILRLIAKGVTVENHYTRWIAEELALIETHSDEGFYHDELSADSFPMLFTEFLSQAAGHGLQFLTEAEYLLPISPGLTDEAREHLRPLEGNRVLLEQYLDFLEGRRFRQTLLCRPGLGMTLQTTRLAQLWVACQAVQNGTPVTSLTGTEAIEFHGLKRARIKAITAHEKAVLLTLTERPGEARKFPDVLAATRERLVREGIAPGDDFDPVVRAFLCRACLPGLVEFSWQQPRHTGNVPARPCAHPLALWQIRHDAPLVWSYRNRFVEVNGKLGRHLLSLLDGTRDHAALADAMRAYLADQHAAARAQGETAGLPDPDDPVLDEQLQRSLTGLAGLGLFQRD